MPRAKMETAFVGWQTLRILAGVPDEQAAWLVKALCAWILDDAEPSNVPVECIGAWIAICDESIRIHEARKIDIENGKKGGRKPKGNPTEPNGNPGETQRNQTETKSKSKKEKENSPSGEGSFSAPATAREEPASHIDPGADFVPSYIVEDWEAICMQAHVAGLTQDQLAAWRDYYAAQGWKFKPTATAPMNRTEALASIRNWARAQKRIDIRDLRRGDPSKFAPSPDKGGIDPAKLGI